MSIRINLPGGVVIEADTLQEAVAVAKAIAPDPSRDRALERITEPAPRRTRVLVTNGDLITLASWGILDEESRKQMGPDGWAAIANELNRSVASVQSLAQRYVWGVYEQSGSDPSAKAVVHAEFDHSRPKHQE